MNADYSHKISVSSHVNQLLTVTRRSYLPELTTTENLQNSVTQTVLPILSPMPTIGILIGSLTLLTCRSYTITLYYTPN